MKIVVIGAAGFVGRQLVAELSRIGAEVYASTKESNRFLIAGAAREAPSVGSIQPDVVVNLAYPTGGSPFESYSLNTQILDSIKQYAGRRAKVIHVSSLAVFGYDLRREIRPGPLRERPDNAYSVAKVHMENLVLESGFRSVDIVRLGNVWGPGSGNWVAGIAERLLAGKPTIASGYAGFSNITDVANVCSYLVYLCGRTAAERVCFHHLAEFSSIRWEEAVTSIASSLDVIPVAFPNHSPGPEGLLRDARTLFRGPNVGARLRELQSTRYAGYFFRLGVAKLPRKVAEGLKKRFKRDGLSSGQEIAAADRDLWTILSSETEFKSKLEADWRPSVNWEMSKRSVDEWLRSVGYIYG